MEAPLEQLKMKQIHKTSSSDYDCILIRAVNKPDGGRFFTLPLPIKAANSSGDLLRIEVSPSVSVGDAVVILREIAKDLADVDRYMRSPKAFVDRVLPLPRKKRFRTPLNGTPKKVKKSEAR